MFHGRKICRFSSTGFPDFQVDPHSLAAAHLISRAGKHTYEKCTFFLGAFAVEDYLSKNYTAWAKRHGVVVRAFVKWLDNSLGMCAESLYARVCQRMSLFAAATANPLSMQLCTERERERERGMMGRRGGRGEEGGEGGGGGAGAVS